MAPKTRKRAASIVSDTQPRKRRKVDHTPVPTTPSDDSDVEPERPQLPRIHTRSTGGVYGKQAKLQAVKDSSRARSRHDSSSSPQVEETPSRRKGRTPKMLKPFASDDEDDEADNSQSYTQATDDDAASAVPSSSLQHSAPTEPSEDGSSPPRPYVEVLSLEQVEANRQSIPPSPTKSSTKQHSTPKKPAVNTPRITRSAIKKPGKPPKATPSHRTRFSKEASNLSEDDEAPYTPQKKRSSKSTTAKSKEKPKKLARTMRKRGVESPPASPPPDSPPVDVPETPATLFRIPQERRDESARKRVKTYSVLLSFDEIGKKDLEESEEETSVSSVANLSDEDEDEDGNKRLPFPIKGVKVNWNDEDEYQSGDDIFTNGLARSSTAETSFNDLDEPVSPTKSRIAQPLPPHLQPFVNIQKRILLQRIRQPPYIEIGPQKDKQDGTMKELETLMRGTIERGEGNSCLLLGPKGSGKSAMLEASLKRNASKCIIIRLSGHSQLTDRHAMREIAYQLSHQSSFSIQVPGGDDDEDDEEGSNNDKPIKFNDAEEEDEYNFSQPAAYLPTLISLLPTLSKPVIVILDAFDLFAEHPRQALLYCLLDTVQSCRAGGVEASGRHGLLVVGMTNKVTCVNLLEKRVKSRFSQRILRVPAFMRGGEEGGELAGVMPFLKVVCEATPGEDDVKKEMKRFVREWKELWAESVRAFFVHKDVVRVLREHCGLLSDPGSLLRLMTSVALKLNTQQPWLSHKALVAADESQRPSRFTVFSKLPQSALYVLTACYLWGHAGHEAFNLAMIYSAYRQAEQEMKSIQMVVSLPGENRSIRTAGISRGVLEGAFEQLVEMKVFQSQQASAQSQGQGGVGKMYTKYKCLIEPAEVRLLVEKYGTTDVKNFLNRAPLLKH